MNSTRTQLKRGFSLIEVAIALAIFVIGALAIIRIFPGALSVINNNGDQLVANNLNRSALARLGSERAMPDATVNIRRDNTPDRNIIWTTEGTADHSADWQDSDTSVTGIPRFNASLPKTPSDPDSIKDSALGSYHAIVGEKSDIVIVNDGGTNEYYALTQFPISIGLQGTPATVQPFNPAVSQDYDLVNTRVNNDGTLDFRETEEVKTSGETSGMAAIPVPANSMLYVTYRYKNSAAKVWGVEEEPVPITTDIPDLRTTLTIEVKPPTTGLSAVTPNGIIPTTVEVRLRRFLGTGSFKTVATMDPALTAERIAEARRGLVWMDTSSLSPIFAPDRPVMLDYIADWSFLLQDGAALVTPGEVVDGAPTPPPAYTLADESYRQIPLGAPFIEDQVNASIYSLVYSPAALTDSMDTDKFFKSAYGEAYPNPDVNDRLLKPTENDLRQGRVTVSVRDSASRVRIAYQTRDNWAQQLSVAARAYKHYVVSSPAGAPEIEPWRDYVLSVTTNGTYLYFHAGEAGKSINISYSYNNGVDINNNPLPDVKIASRPYITQEDLIGAAGLGLPTGFSGTGPDDKVAVVELLTANGDSFPTTAADGVTTVNLTSIQGVRGSSATLRTAYLNGDRYAQSLLTGRRSFDQ